MQIRHVRPDGEAQLALRLEDHERHYGDPVRPNSGAEGADNEGSQRFYDRLGIKRIEKIYYVMDI